MQAFQKQGGTMDYVEPNMGWANAVGSAGQALQGAFNKNAAAKTENGSNDALMAYIMQQQGGYGGGGSTYGNTGNVW